MNQLRIRIAVALFTSLCLTAVVGAGCTPEPTPTAALTSTPTPPPPTETPTEAPTPTPTPTRLSESELSSQGLTYTDGGVLTCGNLDQATYLSTATDLTDDRTVTESRHSGPDYHQTVSSERGGRVEVLELIVIGDASYFRTTRKGPDGETTVLDDWMSGSPFPFPPRTDDAMLCLDTSTYDASVIDPSQPHASTVSESTIHTFSKVENDWWGDEYGRPIRRTETWIPGGSLSGVDEWLNQIDFSNYGADYVIAAPETQPGSY